MRAVSKSEDLAKLCQEILALIRKAGFGNAAEWFRQLDFSKYQFVVRNAFGMLLDRIGKALNFILNRLGSVRHPSNAPVAEWIKTQVKAQRTNWTDVRLPDQAEARALFLAERERSDKIRQEGYARRAIADGGKQSTEEQNQ